MRSSTTRCPPASATATAMAIPAHCDGRHLLRPLVGETLGCGDVHARDVLATEFPENRENNRECEDFRPFWRFVVSIHTAISTCCTQIPDRTEQGIFISEQAIFRRNRKNRKLTASIDFRPFRWSVGWVER